jgi:hypothetical protein
LKRDAVKVKSKGKIGFLDYSNIDQMSNVTYDWDFASLCKAHENPIVILHFLQLSVSLWPLQRFKNWWIAINLLYFLHGKWLDSINSMSYNLTLS